MKTPKLSVLFASTREGELAYEAELTAGSALANSVDAYLMRTAMCEMEPKQIRQRVKLASAVTEYERGLR